MSGESYPTSKTCSRCREEKPVEGFYRSKRTKDGYRYDCKSCCAQGFKDWLGKNRERFNAYMRGYYREKGRTAYYDSERARETYLKNREHVLEQRKRYYIKNRDKVLQRARARTKTISKSRPYDRGRARFKYQKYRDKLLQQAKARYQADPSKAKARAKIREHRLRGAEGSFTPSEWEALCRKYGNRCLCCGASDVALTIDHIVPISKGGTNWITNVQPLCHSCNSSKHTQTIDYRPDSAAQQATPPRPLQLRFEL